MWFFKNSKVLCYDCSVTSRVVTEACRRDGIGRRAGLKILWWRHRMGSTPIAGTMIYVISMDIV